MIDSIKDNVARTKSPAGVLMTVGGSPEPLIHSLLEVRPRFVALICSDDTIAIASTVRAEIEREIGLEAAPQFKTFIVKNASNLVDCHGKTLEALAVFREDFKLEVSDIKIDYTGGTKTMSAAAVLAAAPDGYEFLYIGGSQRTKSGVGIVVSGTEQVISSSNPWIVLEEPAIRQILSYVNNKQWAAAFSAIEVLIKRSDASRKIVFRTLLSVISGLREWDRFNHADALAIWRPGDGKNHLNALGDLATASNLPLLLSFCRKCQKMFPKLEGICKHLNALPEKSDSDPLVIDMLANADRAASLRDYDYSSLLLYRTIELYLDRRLRLVHNIDNGAVLPESVPENLREQFAAEIPIAGKAWKLGLTASARLLQALNDKTVTPLMSKLSDGKIDISARNLSWLIHGNQHASEKQNTAFRLAVLAALSLNANDIYQWPNFEP